MALTKEQIADCKSRGFLINRGTEEFSARIVTKNGVVASEDMEKFAEIAKKYGNGKMILTTRLSIELPGIPYEQTEAVSRETEALGYEVGGTGAKIRPVVCCKGTTCIYGRVDTQELAEEIYERFYIGWGQEKLPHKFKIAVGGCPNNCVKPDLNDFGIAGFKKAAGGQEALYKIYLGGRWGRASRKGNELSVPVTREQAMVLIERSLRLFQKEGRPKERFGMMIDRLGFEQVEKILLRIS